MILCVNANAAIDKTVIVENFQLNAIHRPSFELVLPGGKGCNVARVARTLGLPSLVSGWVGGHAGNFIEEALQEEGIQTAFIHTRQESRTCLSIIDPLHGTLTEIYEKGRLISAEDLRAFTHLYQEWLGKVDLVTLSGSLPAGVPPRLFADLAILAHDAGVRAVLDTSGPALRLGLEEGRLYMLKCNRFELSDLIGQPLADLDDVKQAARTLAERHKMRVGVTLGAAGAIVVEEGRLWLAQAPQIEAVSAVGSGDAFLAGLACALLGGQAFDEALRLGVAAGSANALQLGAGRLSLADVERLLGQVEVKQE
ncbi:MAG: 1-phosphofructokinase family hexose kinase [Anaerolineaceae bacterium]|nr:1-phosphofructokinase family hexose kinase [Anaerolineaceae bacterium]